MHTAKDATHTPGAHHAAGYKPTSPAAAPEPEIMCHDLISSNRWFFPTKNTSRLRNFKILNCP